MGCAREVDRQVQAFPGQGEPETIHHLRFTGIADEHAVVGVDHAILVDILVFDVTHRIGTEFLLGAVVYFLLALEKAEGDITQGDAYGLAARILVAPQGRRRVVFDDGVVGVGHICPELIIEPV